MFSMSAGLIELSASRPTESPPPAPVPIGIPSITYSGSLAALTDVVPRIRMDVLPPGSLVFSITWTPGALLAMSCAGLMMRPVLNCESLTDDTAPVTAPRRCSP